MNLKVQVIHEYKLLLQNRLNDLQQMIADLTQDAQNDAKGSAGDKHETGLAMMHLEQEKLNQKLKEVLEQKELIDSIDATIQCQKVSFGSIVQTDKMLLFVSSALPKISVNNQTIVAISQNAPLIQKMIGSKVNDKISLNSISHQIIEIY